MHTMPMQFTQPPRRVPLSLTVATVFGGFAQIGWAVFGVGMIFFWAFVGNADLSFITFRGAIEQTAGKVTRVEATGASVNETAVMANHYEYSVAGQRFAGTSYTTGSGAAEGEKVTVEYKPDSPDRSRIAGMRRGQFGPFVFFITIFPLIGFVIVYFGTKSGYKRSRLLANGVFTTGKLIDKEPTNMTVNKRRVYALTFEFTARDGRRCEAKAHTSDTARLEDESNEPLLYDPDNPTEAYLLDEVPGRPEINGVGELVGRPVAALFSFALPAIVIGANVAYFYFKLR
jgi:Protein of unknown function (DUF3592)